MFVKSFFAFLLIFVSCSGAQKSNSALTQDNVDSAQNIEKYRVMAVEKYKDHIEYLFNDNKTHVLCIHAEKPSAQHPQKTVSFFVYDLKNEKILYEESVGDGSVQWKNENQIEVTSKIGIITPTHESNVIRYFYDVSTQRKTEEKAQETIDR